MNKFEKQLRNFMINEQMLQAGRANPDMFGSHNANPQRLPDINNPSSTSKDLALLGGFTGTMLGMSLGAHLISKAIERRKFRMKGCNNLTDANKLLRCKQYIKQLELKDLQQSLSKCIDDKCRNTVLKRIEELKNRALI